MRKQACTSLSYLQGYCSGAWFTAGSFLTEDPAPIRGRGAGLVERFETLSDRLSPAARISTDTRR
jgi:hypothetical protein